jgi:hypothetical protein
MKKQPAFPPRYIICLIDLEGWSHEFEMSSSKEAMESWQEDKALKDVSYLHGFFYVQVTSGFGPAPRHLLDSF